MFHQNYFCLQSLLLFILSVESQVTPYNSTKCSNEDLCIQLQNTRRCKRFARSRELLDMFIEPRNNKTHSKTEQEKKKEKEGKEFHKVVDIEKNISKNEIIDTDHKSKNQVIDTDHKSNKILRQKQLIAACAGSKTVFVFEDLVAYQTTRFKKTRIHKNYIEKFICCMSSGQLPTSAFLRSTIIPDPFIMFEIELTFDFYKYPDYWVLSAMELGVTLRDDQYRFQKYDTCPKSNRKSNVSYEEEFEYDTGKGWFNFTCYSTTVERYRILNFGVAANFSIKSEAAAAADLSNPLPGNVMNKIPTFVYENHNYTWPTPVDPWNRTTTMTTTVTTTTQSEEDKEDQEKKKKVNKTASIIGVIVAVILVVAVLKVFAVFALFWWW